MSIVRKWSSRDNSGNIVLGLVLLAVLASSAFFLFQMSVQRGEAYSKALRADQLSNDMQSAIDTFIAVFRGIEGEYISHVTSQTTCSTARPFYLALSLGTGCNATTFEAFEATRVLTTGLATAPAPCRVGNAGASRGQGSDPCLDPKKEREPILRMTSSAHQIGGRAFEFWLHGVDPKMRELHFRVRATPADPQSAQKPEERIIHYSPVFASLAHMNHSGQVLRDRADPIHPCGQEAWDLVRYLKDGRCLELQDFALSQALGYYKGRFFGLEPSSGKVVLLDPDRSGDLSVDPLTGRVQPVGEQVFGDQVLFKYGINNGSDGMRLLQDADDFTITDREIYFLRSAENTSITLRLISVRSDNSVAYPSLCDLSEMGWGQTFEGIVAAAGQPRLFKYNASNNSNGGWSDHNTTPPVLLGLKNTNGAFLQLALRLIPGGTQMADRPPGSIANVPVNCYALYAEEEQQVEFKRTYGFDRVGDDKPYYAF